MAVRRKVKYSKVEKKPEGPQEYNGYVVGQEVWCYRYPNKEISFGKISKINLTQPSGEAIFNFYCEVCGSFRIARFEDIIDEPTPVMKRKLTKSKVRFAKARL